MMTRCSLCGLYQFPKNNFHQFYVVRDKHGDTYAAHVDIDRSPREAVRELCETTVIADEGETVKWGAVVASDAGAARISTEVQWFGSFTFNTNKES